MGGNSSKQPTVSERNGSTTLQGETTQSSQPSLVVRHSSPGVDLLVDVLLNTAVAYGVYYLGKHLIFSMKPFLQEFKQGEKNRNRLQRLSQGKGNPTQQRKKLITTTYEDVIAADVINPDRIDVTFDSIGGLTKQKKLLKELIILPLRRPDLFQTRSRILPIPKGILLYGVPGTGKTMLAKAIAKESGAFFIDLKLSTIMSKYYGESQKLVNAVFSLARKIAPCIIFIDEVDSFMGKRSDGFDANFNAMKTEFMALWDGFASETSKDAGFGVLVMGATNRPSYVDEAFLRRMPRTFEIGLPDQAQRYEILRIILKDEPLSDNVDLNDVAARTEHYSGSDLKELCRAALMNPIREMLEHTNDQGEETYLHENQEELPNDLPTPFPSLRALTMNDFYEAETHVLPTGVSAREYAHNKSRANSSAEPNADTSVPMSALAAMGLMMEQFLRMGQQQQQQPGPYPRSSST